MAERDDRELSTADIATGRSAETSQAGDGGTSAHARGGEITPLISSSDISEHRERWLAIQSKFVDEPQESVREADSLVAEIIQTLARSFADQREQLEGQWSRGSEVSTEDLRRALQQYRSFFERLLAA